MEQKNIDKHCNRLKDDTRCQENKLYPSLSSYSVYLGSEAWIGGGWKEDCKTGLISLWHCLRSAAPLSFPFAFFLNWHEREKLQLLSGLIGCHKSHVWIRSIPYLKSTKRTNHYYTKSTQIPTAISLYSLLIIHLSRLLFRWKRLHRRTDIATLVAQRKLHQFLSIKQDNGGYTWFTIVNSYRDNVEQRIYGWERDWGPGSDNPAISFFFSAARSCFYQEIQQAYRF